MNFQFQSNLIEDQPKLVTDNFCFILDGDKVRLSEMIADDSWKQTGHPTKFYYSEDLRVFHKVQMITSNGRVVRAQFSRPKKSAAKHQRHRLTRRRDSEPTKFVDEPPEEIDPKGEVPLSKVYKVTRFYSFWRSCAGFHRIITVITPGAGGIGQNATSPEMKKRFFVQYIWRNASEADRVRVGAEFQAQQAHLQHQHDGSGSSSRNSSRRQSTISALSACDF